MVELVARAIEIRFQDEDGDEASNEDQGNQSEAVPGTHLTLATLDSFACFSWMFDFDFRSAKHVRH
jgi:hypothetical protein